MNIYDDGDKSIQLKEILNFIFNHADDLIIILNDKLQFEWINQVAHEKKLGYTKDNLLGNNAPDFIHPDDIEHVFEQLNDIFEKREGRVTARVKRADGQFIWVDIRGHIFQSKSGMDKMFIIGRDISELKTSEQKLRESEEKYRLIMENAEDFLLVLNDRFKIEYFNEPAIFNILGYTYEDGIGKNILRFLHPDEYEKAINSITTNLSQQHRQEFRIRKKDGNYIWGEVKGSSFVNRKGEKKYFLFIRDVSMKKEAEQKLKESEEKYRNAYEHADFLKDLFTHDINNILQTILSTTELGTLTLTSESTIEDFGAVMNDIKKQVLRGASLVSNVRTLSKIESKELLMKEMELFEILKTAIANISNSYEQEINIQLEIPEQKILVMANELLLEVFENIITNAIKHNDNLNKELSIIISKEKEEEIPYIRMEFIDNGYGVEDNQKRSIFERGYKSDKNVSGMGLGLSLIKTIIDSYKGHVWVEDKVKGDYTQGSNFILLIPEAY